MDVLSNSATVVKVASTAVRLVVKAVSEVSLDALVLADLAATNLAGSVVKPQSRMVSSAEALRVLVELVWEWLAQMVLASVHLVCSEVLSNQQVVYLQLD